MTQPKASPHYGTLPLKTAFATLKLLSDQTYITGLDDWRHPTGNDSLSNFDSELAALVKKQPPSKFGRAERPSLWTSTHFYLALPALSYAIMQYAKDTTTAELELSTDELRSYLPGFPYVVRHYREYKEFVQCYGAPTEDKWDALLQTPLATAPDNASAAALLTLLPPYLREKALKTLSGEADSLVGRIVLAYLLSQGTDPKKLSLHEHTERYLESMHGKAPSQTLYQRLIIALAELGELDLYLGQFDETHHLCLSELMGLVQWYGRPHLVEMVIPGLTGAAEPTIRGLLALFDRIIAAGGPDYTNPPLEALPSAQKFLGTQSLEAIGRFSIVKDILTQAGTQEPDGSTVRQLATYLYSETKRRAAWGNAEYYVPSIDRGSGFATFRQDIANILYCAGLFAENDNMAGTIETEALTQLARQVRKTRSVGGIRKALHGQRRILNSLAIEWEMRYAGHERLRLLRFVRQTFGLDTVAPVPISLSELNKGFAGSHYDGRVYHLCYQEAGEKLEMAITVGPEKEPSKTVRYHTISDTTEPRITPDGLPYSAWLEVATSHTQHTVVIPVPGRGSFDPFGRVGSAHAGEVIGFGCSVHHASLAIVLAELASLGAGRGDLERVAAAAFMRINQTMHERFDLAAFQLAQTIAAFWEGTTYTHADFIRSRQNLLDDPLRPHLVAYTRIGKKSLAWAEPQAARLAFAYPALYPQHGTSVINPRHSWYDGHDVELPDATVHWCVLTC